MRKLDKEVQVNDFGLVGVELDLEDDFLVLSRANGGILGSRKGLL